MIDFEDTDLGIVALCLLAVLGCITGILLKIEAAGVFSFLGACATGIAGLVRGNRRNASPPADPDHPPG